MILRPPSLLVTTLIVCSRACVSMGWSQFGQRLFSKLIYVDWHQSITGKQEVTTKGAESKKTGRKSEHQKSISSPDLVLENLLRLQNRFPRD